MFEQSTAFLLLLSSASITKNQGFVPGGQTIILSEASHHRYKQSSAVREDPPHHPARVNEMKEKLNPEQRREQSAVVKKSLSVLFFCFCFQLFSFISLAFSSRPQIIHSSGGEEVQRIESRQDLGGGEAGVKEGIWG